ncbi:MAG: DUF4347 domain-containing protein [Cyanobacteria bacterium P01_D01_bin.36]
MPSSVCPRLQFCSPQSKPNLRAQRVQLAVFDSRVKELSVLLSGLQPGVRPFVLNAEKDGIEQISAVIQLVPIHEIVIVAPGFRGGLQLGSTTLTLKNLAQYEHQLRGWFSDIDKPEISLLANSVASGKAGSELVTQLRNITGATVRASAQPIGRGHWLTATAKTFRPLVLNTYSATL